MITIYLTITFIVPGLTYKAIAQALTLTVPKEKKGTVYEQLFYIVANSIVISSISTMVLKLFGAIEELPETLEGLMNELNNLEYAVKFIAAMVIICALWFAFVEFFVKKISTWVKNLYFKSRYNVTLASSDGNTTWEEIMLSQKKTKRKPLVAIFNGDDLVQAGFIDTFEQGVEPTVMTLAREEKVKRLLMADGNKNEDEKLFDKVEKTYYDLRSGKKIVFYDSEKVYEHWDK
jgi:hypothetical protein